MARWLKWLVVAEVIVCFSPLLIILLIGTLMLPVQFVGLLFYGENTLPFLALVFGGLAGVSGVLILLTKYLRSDTSTADRGKIRVCIGIGFLTFAYYAYESYSGDVTIYLVLMFVPPMLCAVHVLYLTRLFLFGHGANAKEDKGA